MSALTKVLEIYDCKELRNIMEYCSEHGVFHSEKNLFICGYPTHSSLIGAGRESLLRQNVNKGVDKPDTWFIYIASGDLNKAFCLGNSYKYIAYERFDGKIRLIELERLRRYYGKSRNAKSKRVTAAG